MNLSIYLSIYLYNNLFPTLQAQLPWVRVLDIISEMEQAAQQHLGVEARIVVVIHLDDVQVNYLDLSFFVSSRFDAPQHSFPFYGEYSILTLVSRPWILES